MPLALATSQPRTGEGGPRRAGRIAPSPRVRRRPEPRTPRGSCDSTPRRRLTFSLLGRTLRRATTPQQSHSQETHSKCPGLHEHQAARARHAPSFMFKREPLELPQPGSTSVVTLEPSTTGRAGRAGRVRAGRGRAGDRQEFIAASETHASTRPRSNPLGLADTDGTTRGGFALVTSRRMHEHRTTVGNIQELAPAAGTIRPPTSHLERSGGRRLGSMCSPDARP